ncbi:MAG: hypothetical protein RL154_780 [Pseudomonadota bacterium]|jgi:3,4-dihydroxy 2-butanone 4-phosphate synthase/GTP cyclohydrolase II
MPIERVKKAIEEIKKGSMVVMMDDEDRENEGDLVYAGLFSTPQKVNFMASMAKGLICVSITKEAANSFGLKHMVERNDSAYETAFTISVDAKGCTTGISAYERDDCIQLLSKYDSKPDDFVKPGHIFPLIAKDGGVLERTGHTEGSIDLCKLAGVYPSGVICEIMNADGTMARRDDLQIFAKKHNLAIVYVSDLVEYRLRNECLVKECEREKTLFLNHECEKIVFSDHLNQHHTVYIFGEIGLNLNVKFHNIGQDLTLLQDSTKFNSLLKSTEYLAKNSGALVFMNSHISHGDKDFGIGAQILHKLGSKTIKLLTGSAHKSFSALSGFGLAISEVIEI